MKKSLLLLSGAVIAAAGASAQGMAVNVAARPSESKVVSPILQKAKAKRVSVIEKDGIRMKQASVPVVLNSKVNPVRAHKSRAKAAAEGVTMYESFEGWDGENADWLPDGWTMKSLNDERPLSEKWGVCECAMPGWLPTPSNGDYYIGISYSEDPSDEWIMTPVVEVGQYDQLSFTMNESPFWYFKCDSEHLDADNYTWIGEQEVAYTLQVMGREEGAEEWTLLHDFAQDYIGMEAIDLLMMETMDMLKRTIDISSFAGKRAQFALRYVGTDGNSVFIDEVTVGVPPLEVSYMMPLNSLYWGVDQTPTMSYLTLPIVSYPVYEDLVWQNTSEYNPQATYFWEYSDPATSDMVTTDEDPDMLTVAYEPDFSSEFTTRNNLYYLPVLHGTAPGSSEGTFTSDAAYLQAGGASDYVFSDGTSSHYGLLPFPLQTEGLTLGTCDPEDVGGDYGDPATPVFGYDKNTSKFWNLYTFQGEQEEGDNVELVAIMNYLYPGEQPLVVNGLWLNAKGKVGADATFKAEIIPLSDEGVPMDTPLASATVKGSEILSEEGGSQDYLCLPFKFETPVEISSANHIAYIVKVSGFNDPANVTYFAPFQSEIPNRDELAIGWVEKVITFAGESRTSYSPVAYLDFGYGDAYNSFAISIDGYYPYLRSDVESLEVKRGEPQEVPMISYYPAEQLTVSVDGCDHAGVSATVSGQYDKCMLTIADNCVCESEHNYTVTVSAPGVKKQISVTSVSGIDAIGSDASSHAAPVYYTLQGVRVAKPVAGGIYIRVAGSKAEKVSF